MPISRERKELHRKKATKVKPTENPRPVQHRKQNSNEVMLRRLKIPESSLSIAFRHIEPSWRNYIQYAGFAAKQGDEDMAKLIATYQELPPRERTAIMPEKLCDLAGVDPGDLIATVSREIWKHKHPESVITASMKHPKVLEATANYAINSPFAEKDRELFFRLAGSLPDKKGTSIVINNTAQHANFDGPPSPGMSGYKSMDQRVIEMGKLLDDPAEIIAVPMSSKDSDFVFEEADESED